jgi:hypothetical protein
MRAALLALLFLSGCDSADHDRQTTTVLSYRGDPDNFTASGFPRHAYPIQSCGYQIKLKAPFEVSEDGLGDADIRVPLSLLDDASVRTLRKMASTRSRGCPMPSRASMAARG